MSFINANQFRERLNAAIRADLDVRITRALSKALLELKEYFDIHCTAYEYTILEEMGKKALYNVEKMQGKARFSLV